MSYRMTLKYPPFWCYLMNEATFPLSFKSQELKMIRDRESNSGRCATVPTGSATIEPLSPPLTQRTSSDANQSRIRSIEPLSPSPKQRIGDNNQPRIQETSNDNDNEGTWSSDWRWQPHRHPNCKRRNSCISTGFETFGTQTNCKDRSIRSARSRERWREFISHSHHDSDIFITTPKAKFTNAKD